LKLEKTPLPPFGKYALEALPMVPPLALELAPPLGFVLLLDVAWPAFPPSNVSSE